MASLVTAIDYPINANSGELGENRIESEYEGDEHFEQEEIKEQSAETEEKSKTEGTS